MNGTITEPLSVALNTSTYTAIQIPEAENLKDKFFPVSAYTSDGTTFYISKEESPGTDKPILDTAIYNNNYIKRGLDGTIFWAKADAGTPSLIVHVGRPEK